MSSEFLSETEYSAVYGISDSILNEVGKVITGKRRETALILAAMISGGHILIEDVPGVGKTTLAASVAKAAGLSFKRAQFTPDVMASDITGFNIYNRKTESFEFREGLVNTNILLADEINRASPKTQSSLLEAMEETQVTVDGVTYDIPDPFTVIATQNPAGFVGTYPLPEAQLDRFALRIKMGYPTPEEEIMILKRRLNGDPITSVRPVGKNAVQLLRADPEQKLRPRHFVAREEERPDHGDDQSQHGRGDRHESRVENGSAEMVPAEHIVLPMEGSLGKPRVPRKLLVVLQRNIDHEIHRNEGEKQHHQNEQVLEKFGGSGPYHASHM